MGIHRSAIQRARRNAAAETKAVNQRFKAKERRRRDARMFERVKAGSPPYTPDVASWLSAKLGKKPRQITPEDIAGLTA